MDCDCGLRLWTVDSGAGSWGFHRDIRGGQCKCNCTYQFKLHIISFVHMIAAGASSATKEKTGSCKPSPPEASASTFGSLFLVLPPLSSPDIAVTLSVLVPGGFVLGFTSPSSHPPSFRGIGTPANWPLVRKTTSKKKTRSKRREKKPQSWSSSPPCRGQSRCMRIL